MFHTFSRNFFPPFADFAVYNFFFLLLENFLFSLFHSLSRPIRSLRDAPTTRKRQRDETFLLFYLPAFVQRAKLFNDNERIKIMLLGAEGEMESFQLGWRVNHFLWAKFLGFYFLCSCHEYL